MEVSTPPTSMASALAEHIEAQHSPVCSLPSLSSLPPPPLPSKSPPLSPESPPSSEPPPSSESPPSSEPPPPYLPLPAELVPQILRYLPLSSLLTTARVSPLFHQASRALVLQNARYESTSYHAREDDGLCCLGPSATRGSLRGPLWRACTPPPPPTPTPTSTPMPALARSSTAPSTPSSRAFLPSPATLTPAQAPPGSTTPSNSPTPSHADTPKPPCSSQGDAAAAASTAHRPVPVPVPGQRSASASAAVAISPHASRLVREIRVLDIHDHHYHSPHSGSNHVPARRALALPRLCTLRLHLRPSIHAVPHLCGETHCALLPALRPRTVVLVNMPCLTSPWPAGLPRLPTSAKRLVLRLGCYRLDPATDASVSVSANAGASVSVSANAAVHQLHKGVEEVVVIFHVPNPTCRWVGAGEGGAHSDSNCETHGTLGGHDMGRGHGRDRRQRQRQHQTQHQQHQQQPQQHQQRSSAFFEQFCEHLAQCIDRCGAEYDQGGSGSGMDVAVAGRRRDGDDARNGVGAGVGRRGRRRASGESGAAGTPSGTSREDRDSDGGDGGGGSEGGCHGPKWTFVNTGWISSRWLGLGTAAPETVQASIAAGVMRCRRAAATTATTAAGATTSTAATNGTATATCTTATTVAAASQAGRGQARGGEWQGEWRGEDSEDKGQDVQFLTMGEYLRRWGVEDGAEEEMLAWGA